MRIFRIEIASLPQVFICIDALDEFLPKDPLELPESLEDIVRRSPKIGVFLTEEGQNYAAVSQVASVATHVKYKTSSSPT